MIYGIGTDIVKVARFGRWIDSPGMIGRFFNPCEIVPHNPCVKRSFLCQHYAARFAAKEALAKALGTGFAGMSLSDFGIVNSRSGKPGFCLGEKTRLFIDSRCGANWSVQVSVSHEKEFATACVVIEITG